MIHNECDWRDMSTLPEAGATVLIHVPNDVETVWFGFWDGRRWHYIEGLPVRAKVHHWCQMPQPPREAVAEVPKEVVPIEALPVAVEEALVA